MRVALPAALCLALQVVPAGAGASGPAGVSDAEAARGECALEAARRVQKHYERIGDLRAHFLQTTQSVTLGGAASTALEAEGEVVFAKPGRMRWSYHRPQESLVLSDGRVLWIYDPERKEAQRMEVTEAFMSGAAIQFLLGEGDLLEEFDISSPDCAKQNDPTKPSVRIGLELIPRAPSHYERLSIVVDSASGAVHATTVIDLFGNRTQVELRDVEMDQDPPDELFRFEPPDGVRVFDPSGTQDGRTPATTQ
ncbi:MAG: outer membrane lipoprotein carrier protein LolA [Myxococcota bacterium]